MGMLAKTLKSCKDNMRVEIFRNDADMSYWLSSGTVAINLGAEFAASDTDIIKMLELPPEKSTAVMSVVHDEPQKLPAPGSTLTEPLEKLVYGIVAEGHALQPFKTDRGTLFVQHKYLDVFKEFNNKTVDYYLDELKNRIVVCVVADECLVGMIAPFQMPYDKLGKFASKFMKLVYKARQNGFIADSEQTSLLDDEAADDAEE